MAVAERHSALSRFPVEDGCLVIGGIPLPRLAARVGATPFFAYDRGLITERVTELRRALPRSVHLSYAIKANPMPAVVQHLASLVDGFDVASIAEMKTALDTPMAPDRVSFAGPGKTEAEIGQAIAAGIVLTVESRHQLQTASRLAAVQRRRARIAVRVNPDFEVKSSGMRMGGGAKQFGIDAEAVPQLFAAFDRDNLDFEGFHIFSGSQNLRAASLIEAQQKTVELALRLAELAPGPVRFLNLGGGFGIPYFPDETPLDLTAVGANLARLVPEIESRLPRARIVIELGRYIVGEAGVYVCRVLDRKESRGRIFLVTDGGLHHHLAASGNFGQVLRKNYPVAVGHRIDSDPVEDASVVGCLCTPLDLLGDRVQIPHAEVGDLIVVFQSGAYGLTASPTAFLSHPAPLEVLA